MEKCFVFLFNVHIKLKNEKFSRWNFVKEGITQEERKNNFWMLHCSWIEGHQVKIEWRRKTAGTIEVFWKVPYCLLDGTICDILIEWMSSQVKSHNGFKVSSTPENFYRVSKIQEAFSSDWFRRKYLKTVNCAGSSLLHEKIVELWIWYEIFNFQVKVASSNWMCRAFVPSCKYCVHTLKHNAQYTIRQLHHCLLLIQFSPSFQAKNIYHQRHFSSICHCVFG